MVGDEERGDGEEEEEEEEGGAAGERGSVELLVRFRPEKEARP